jgi:hypothetical protein
MTGSVGLHVDPLDHVDPLVFVDPLDRVDPLGCRDNGPPGGWLEERTRAFGG